MVLMGVWVGVRGGGFSVGSWYFVSWIGII